jgi:hypothetical protein
MILRFFNKTLHNYGLSRSSWPLVPHQIKFLRRTSSSPVTGKLTQPVNLRACNFYFCQRSAKGKAWRKICTSNHMNVLLHKFLDLFQSDYEIKTSTVWYMSNTWCESRSSGWSQTRDLWYSSLLPSPVILCECQIINMRMALTNQLNETTISHKTL